MGKEGLCGRVYGGCYRRYKGELARLYLLDQGDGGIPTKKCKATFEAVQDFQRALPTTIFIVLD